MDFIGIGGCGMSGLARMLHAMGITCSGSDINPSSTISSLVEEGLSIRTAQDGFRNQLAQGLRGAVVSAARKHDSVEQAVAILWLGGDERICGERVEVVELLRGGLDDGGRHGVEPSSGSWRSTRRRSGCEFQRWTGGERGAGGYGGR